MDEGQGQVYARRMTRLEKLSIFLIVVLSAGSILWMGHDSGRQSRRATSAVVFKDGLLVAELNLSKNNVFTLPSKEMDIEVNEGKVRVARSNCRKQICVRTGWIQVPGEVIVCVPNRILIEVQSTKAPLVDAVVR